MMISALLFAVLFAVLCVFYLVIYRKSVTGGLSVGRFGGPVNPDTTASEQVWQDTVRRTARFPLWLALISGVVAVGEVLLSMTDTVMPMFLVAALAIAVMFFMLVRYNLTASAIAREQLGLAARHRPVFRESDTDDGAAAPQGG
ncbi:hypothetical protein ACFPVT_08985 [Corynebacterium choanae]|uniref:SdpI family protein n=1 Tax=Corynebacterium choanae TaxID=1862358 RepID=A0A3G6J5P3_9CORY|nr:hypothetical protein [Corynebacterium choanae]AZA13405.1 hypothetical protein CCHOA_04995 [Corynebacterium choanae]